MRDVFGCLIFCWLVAFVLFPEKVGNEVGEKAAAFMKGWHAAQPPVTVPRVACREG